MEMYTLGDLSIIYWIILEVVNLPVYLGPYL